MTSCAVFPCIPVVTDRTSMFCGDKFPMFSDIGMAVVALDVLFNQVFFMWKIHAKDLFVDFFNPGVTSGTLSWDLFSYSQKTFGLIRRAYHTQSF